LIDYALGRGARIEGDEELIAELMPDGSSAWDENCSQHIPRRFEAADAAAALAERDNHIRTLEAEIKQLHKATRGASS
jgi:hypothetical protein